MRTEPLCLGAAAAVAAQILWLTPLGPAVAAAAAALTAGTLFFLQGKPVCAESSRQ